MHTLPALPVNLQSLQCDYDSLSSLPALPATLTYLSSNYNDLTSLPSLPSGLKTLVCNNTPITSLPTLTDSLTYLDVTNCTQLSCLSGPIYNSLTLNYSGTAISCMPSRFHCTQFAGPNPNSLPLCGAASGCPHFYSISGNVHQDTSANCTLDSLHNGRAINGVKLLLSSNGQVVRQAYSYGSGFGQYSMGIDSITSYTLSVDTTASPFMVVCPANNIRLLPLTATDSTRADQDFGLECRGVDNGVSVMYGRFRAARNSNVRISAGDLARIRYGAICAGHSSGTVTTVLSGPVTFVSPMNGALVPVVTGDTLTYTITNFDSVSLGAFNIVLKTDTHANIGQSVCITTSVLTDGGVDMNPTNDALTECFAVINSYDPNIKTVSPMATVDTGAQWLTYTVAFQNTGNDTAYDIIVRDTLSNSIDPASFQLLGSSHTVRTDILKNAVKFLFANIKLVDSMHNEPLSHGWVQYKVKTRPHLPLGTQVKNKASIYFDFNPAVVTNTTSNTVAIPAGIRSIDAPADLRVYPNPNNGSFTLATGSLIGSSFVITDMLGQTVIERTITSDAQQVDMSTAAAGIYTLTLKGKNGAVRVVVK